MKRRVRGVLQTATQTGRTRMVQAAGPGAGRSGGRLVRVGMNAVHGGCGSSKVRI